MERAGLLLYDDARQLVVVAGSHGVEAGLLVGAVRHARGDPIAQVALSEDRVVEVTGDLGRWVPERYARISGLETLCCVPVSAAGRWLGVIFTDRGGTRFELTDAERHDLWTLGKTAALAASVRIATSQQGRARLLQARIDLARELHERVVQRLFGVSMVLGSDHALSEEARRRCADEMHAALADLREALSRPLAPPTLDTGATCAASSRGSGATTRTCRSSSTGRRAWRCPMEVESLAQSVLAEALRNADKHARPSSVRVHVGQLDGAFLLEVRNDGARGGARRGAGMGLRLAAVEALQRGALVEFGPEGGDWRVRLVVPLEEDSAE